MNQYVNDLQLADQKQGTRYSDYTQRLGLLNKDLKSIQHGVKIPKTSIFFQNVNQGKKVEQGSSDAFNDSRIKHLIELNNDMPTKFNIEEKGDSTYFCYNLLVGLPGDVQSIQQYKEI